MKATGIVRRIDELGRVVIPKEIRRTQRIRRGDPLEIFTTGDGEVIFKKYSPIGELASFAAQYAETLHRVCSLAVIICDRDAIIACSGVPKKDYSEKSLSAELEHVMEGRNLYFHREGDAPMPVLSEDSAFEVSCAMPIISEGDVVGCVASVVDRTRDTRREAPTGEVETKLILTAAGFLGKQLET